MAETEKPHRRGRGGRPPKSDPAVRRCSVNFTEEEYIRLLEMFERSGVLSKAAFIKARIFGDEFRVIRSDRSRSPICRSI
ncbi:plasmid mobilization protein [Alistipes onderdonkii]|uniref:plasmid mobilization protein n=1 Tax=Alistipes onderdonkii TaxID=328813 RepID=UPI001143A3B0|nr:hypothetical protein [Alistipes onderdonkii]